MQKCETYSRVHPSLRCPVKSLCTQVWCSVPVFFPHWETPRGKMQRGRGVRALCCRKGWTSLRSIPSRSRSRRHTYPTAVSHHRSCPVTNSAQGNELSWCRGAGIHPSQDPPCWVSRARSEKKRMEKVWIKPFLTGSFPNSLLRGRSGSGEGKWKKQTHEALVLAA